MRSCELDVPCRARTTRIAPTVWIDRSTVPTFRNAFWDQDHKSYIGWNWSRCRSEGPFGVDVMPPCNPSAAYSGLDDRRVSSMALRQRTCFADLAHPNMYYGAQWKKWHKLIELTSNDSVRRLSEQDPAKAQKEEYHRLNMQVETPRCQEVAELW